MWTQSWGPNALNDARSRFGFLLPDHQPQAWFLPMPPPNITGQLHLGHALFLTLQDIQTRYRALRGDDALWLPGTDHAGLATHDKILQEMERQHLDPQDAKKYQAIGWEWKNKHHAIITHQMKRMGASCDWSKERFTLDASYQSSARHAFKQLWEQGLITTRDGQWWMEMEALSKPLLTALGDGTLRINPLRSHHRLLHFLNNIEPWCLSRQIGWGLPIPLKQQEDGSWLFDEGEHTPGAACTDTLDTWFLSALWPFASLGWPEQTPDLNTYFPGQWMETGEDILFFWCARMWMLGHALTGQWPFTRIFCHGLIRDKEGQKMSKSLGNGIDPLALMDQYGTDALRWHLALRAHPAKDIRFDQEKMEKDGAWLNKIWQAGRFMSQFGPPPSILPDLPPDLQELRHQINDCWEQDRYPDACQMLQKAFRHEFCNLWLEHHKSAMRAGDRAIIDEAWCRLSCLLGLLHPIIPFMTTELHQTLGLSGKGGG